MGFMKHFRSKSKQKEKSKSKGSNGAVYYPVPRGRDYSCKLPDKVLKLIFSYVCPHAEDGSYESCEDSQLGDGCMLCDLRDLSNCAQVRRSWYPPAAGLLCVSL